MRPTFGIERRTGRSIVTSALALAVAANGSHCANRLKLTATDRSIGRGRGRRMFAQEKLRQRREKILERLQIRGATKQIIQHFILNVRH